MVSYSGDDLMTDEELTEPYTARAVGGLIAELLEQYEWYGTRCEKDMYPLEDCPCEDCRRESAFEERYEDE